MTTLKSFKSGIIMVLVIGMIVIFQTGCEKSTDQELINQTDLTKDALLNFSSADLSNASGVNIAAFPMEDLSPEEIAALTEMREEEYLAHDVYLKLSQRYTRPIFNNIRKSELVHTNAVKALLVKYNLPDPAANHVTGVFTDPTLQGLYNTLVAQGYVSLLNGMVVGATIEDLDIFDLDNLLLEVDNQDIIATFNHLRFGSCNHMRAFYANIVALGGTYSPQFISQEEFDEIINK